MSAPNPKAFPLANAQLTNQVGVISSMIPRAGCADADGVDPRSGPAGFSLQAAEEGVSRLAPELPKRWERRGMAVDVV